uniref:Cytochrome P450 71A18 n=1 Tax=Lygus hesperus TaxID=30085 RepID=A0A0A9ZFI2_LYGHE
MGESLDGEFHYLSGVANRISQALNDHDQKLARKWINKISSYNSKNLEVARSRNELMRNLVGVLRSELLFRVLSTKKVKAKIRGSDLKELRREIATFGEPGHTSRILKNVYEPDRAQTSFMSIWSPDKRTYLAAKPIGGEGALIYMAVTPHPELGWDLPDPNAFTTDFYSYPTDDCMPPP